MFYINDLNVSSYTPLRLIFNKHVFREEGTSLNSRKAGMCILFSVKF